MTHSKGGPYMHCSNCGKEGIGKFCADCGGLLVEDETVVTEENKQYIQPPRTPLETDELEYVGGATINITEVMEYYQKDKEYGIEVLAYYSGMSLQEAEKYIYNKMRKNTKLKKTFFDNFKINFNNIFEKKHSEKKQMQTEDTVSSPSVQSGVKTDFLEVDEKNFVTFRSIDMIFTGILVAKAKNDKYVMAKGSYGKQITIDCYVFFNRERALHKVVTQSDVAEAYVTNTGAFSLYTTDGRFYLYDFGQKETLVLELEEDNIQIMTSYFCEQFTILLYKKDNKYFLSIYNTQKGSFIYKKYFDMDFEQISKSRIQVTDTTIEVQFPCGLMLQYDFRGNAISLQEEKNTLNRLYYPIAYVNNAVDKMELLRQDETEARKREIRALFELAIEKVGDMYWCYDNYACFEAEFGDMALAKKYLLKAENSQAARNAKLYRKCGEFALKRDMKEYALEFLEKAIYFQIDAETLQMYKTVKQELEEKAQQQKQQTKGISALFKREKKKEETEEIKDIPKEEEEKSSKKIEKKSPLEAFLPQEEINPIPTEPQKEQIKQSEEVKEQKEESEFEKRRKAREEMRARHRRGRKLEQKEEQ